jgi:DNA-binding GntR family transcriptional regulator
MNVEDQLLQIEVRRELEHLVAILASRRATRAEREELLAIADNLEDAAEMGDELAVLRLAARFHSRTALCTKNQFAASAIIPLRTLARRFWYAHYRTDAASSETVQVHAHLLRMIASADEVAAAAAADTMMDAVAQSTSRVVSELLGISEAVTHGP